MMTIRLLMIAAVMVLLSPGAARPAGTGTFVEDFQDGKADGWKAGGKGSVQLTTYAGNVSMRLTKKAFALIVLPVTGGATAHLSAAFAASDLERGDACLAEVSLDQGKSWTEFHRVEDGADDAVTLHAGAGQVAVPEDVKTLVLRVRIAGNGEDDTCWADNIQLVVTPRQTSQSQTSQGQTFQGQTGPRRELSADFLLGTAKLKKPVTLAAFTPSPGAGSPSATFRGRLSVTPSEKTAKLDAVTDLFWFTADPLPGLKTLPAFEIAFVQDGDRLIPVERGLVRTSSQAWDLFIEPGRVWSEPEDQGYSRAALPFALQEKNANCTHNGVLTFLFKGDGSVSRVAYQISSETCYYFKADMWGTAAARYAPQNVPGAERIVEAYRREMARRLPVKPISELSRDHPELDAQAFGAPTDIPPEHMTTFGVVVGGVHYRGGCATRAGPYPFCENVVLPSYSVAKSVFTGLAMMRLEMLYPGAFEALIADYVPECAGAGWADVTFGQALDMATGRYKSLKSEADEDAAVQDGFFIDFTHKEKIERACTLYPERTSPGRKWVYHTTDHYILGTAMQAFLRRRLGPEADIHRDLIVEPLWKRIGLSPLSYKTRRTLDDVRQPFVGWGLSFLPDDFAKFARFIAVQNGRWEGEALVDAGQLDAALQRRPDDPGLPAPSRDFRYNNGFWAWNAASAVGCDHALWVPFMSGFGGISVVLMPNGVLYYYVSDNDDYAWARAIAAADAYAPMCARG